MQRLASLCCFGILLSITELFQGTDIAAMNEDECRTMDIPILTYSRSTSQYIRVKRTGNFKTILSLDGGGLRGLIPGDISCMHCWWLLLLKKLINRVLKINWLYLPCSCRVGVSGICDQESNRDLQIQAKIGGLEARDKGDSRRPKLLSHIAGRLFWCCSWCDIYM